MDIKTEPTFELDDEPLSTQIARMKTPDIKTDVKIEIKSEPIGEEQPTTRRSARRGVYKCRLCPKKTKSKYEIVLHLHKKHEPKCQNCNLKFGSWNQCEKHEPFCSRKNGLIVIPLRPAPLEKPKNLPFKCQLCYRKYEKYQHLYNHQVQRCKKRYVSTNWIVKI